MSLPNLYYFDMGGRAETIRALLGHAKVQYNDERKTGQAWKDLKPTLPLGSMPVWEEDGFMVCQSSAILRMLGIRYGYYPEDPMQAWACDSIVDFLEDLTGKYVGVLFDVNNAEKQEGWFTNYWDKVLPVIEARLAHGKTFIAGTDRPTICDFKAFSVQIAWDTECNRDGVEMGMEVQQRLKQLMQDRYPKFWAWRQVMCGEMAEYLPTRVPRSK